MIMSLKRIPLALLLTLALFFAGATALSACATTGAVDYKALNCQSGCNDAADSCTISCVRQMGAGSKETCETNCGRAKQKCYADCMR